MNPINDQDLEDEAEIPVPAGEYHTEIPASAGDDALKRLVDLLRQPDGGARSISCTGMWGSSKAFFLEQARARSGRTLLVVCPSDAEARALWNDLRFFQNPVEIDEEAAPAAGDDLELVEAKTIVGDVVLFPGWGVQLHEQSSPPRDAILARIVAYNRILQKRPCIVVATTEALAFRGLSPDRFRTLCIPLELEREIDPSVLVGRLVEAGYSAVDLVESPGQFSKRGGIVDVFSPQYAWPMRIEFFGDTIESLRFFDSSTQRSRAALVEATLIPCSEIASTKEEVPKAKASIVKRATLLNTVEEALVTLLDEFDRRRHFPGAEWYLTHLFQPVSLLDWLAPGDPIVLDGASAIAVHVEEVRKEQEWEIENNLQRLWIPVHLEQLYQPPAAILEAAGRTRIDLEVLRIESGNRVPRAGTDQPPIEIAFAPRTLPPVRGRWEEFFAQVRQFLSRGYTVTIVGPMPSDLEHLKQMLVAHEVPGAETSAPLTSGGRIVYVRGNLTLGFLEAFTKQVFFTIAEIYGKARRNHRVASNQSHEFIGSFRDLKIGDYVVHLDHGIGSYLGLRRLNVAGVQGDYLELQYDGTDKLYVPMSMIHLIQRYRAVQDEDSKVYLDKLGSASWGRVKERVKKAIRQMAGELLELYAARKMVEGIAFSPDGPLQHEFEARFEFDPTPDQQRTIDQIRDDMESDIPMDRLVCGDVGFGKTEVAMRAAHKATLDGYQVAVLVPTTILAQQHFNTFTRRFRGFNTNIEMISRFVPPKKVKEVTEGLKNGTVQIVIGTHALLGRTIEFAKLGLLIVDEEHHFGVAHKEKIKKLKKRIDVLTLTATPIPRTLHFSMVQVRDLSIINTAPVDRLPVITRVATFQDDVVKEAIDKELNRGGQVFFLHNRVQSIDEVAARIRKIVPRAKIAVAHGQMEEKLLEQIMVDFVNKRYHVLVCTAIIESGLDIPAANTIIINRADRFGLAQLYQLRGRVGRSRRRAYCYLLTPPIEMLAHDAQERLRVIQELTELGSGLRLAAHDMEIRGAGNLLGGEQSGHIEAIGFDTYSKLLEQTMQEMQGIGVEEDRPEPAIKLDIDAYLPDDYVPDINQKLMIYRSLSSARTLEEVSDVEETLLDRYGKPPAPAEALLDNARLRALCLLRRVEKVDLAKGFGAFVFAEDARISHKEFKRLLTEFEGRLTYKPPFTIKLTKTTPKELIQLLKDVET